MRLVLHVWRQKSPRDTGKFVTYEAKDVSEEMSFLEMIDVVNEDLIHQGELPITIDSDCREGICGTCGCMVNGKAHGPLKGTALCQVHMRHFHDGVEVWIEPFRARAFPLIKDLVVDRAALDHIVAAGGFISTPTGSAPEANSILVAKDDAEQSMDAAACIGCGACVATCPNASASLFTGAKISHLALLPQGHPERESRAIRMVEQARAEGFGHCTLIGECSTVCPKQIPLTVISRMNREFLRGAWRRGDTVAVVRKAVPAR